MLGFMVGVGPPTMACSVAVVCIRVCYYRATKEGVSN
jgi:hypothetical protein